ESTIHHCLSLHDALPIFPRVPAPTTVGTAPHDAASDVTRRAARTPAEIGPAPAAAAAAATEGATREADRSTVTTPTTPDRTGERDRKSTRLNSSHQIISY